MKMYRLNIFALFIFSFFALSKITYAQANSEKSLSPRIAEYTIEASLDVNKKIIIGKETLKWRNTSKDFIKELQFHLYLNAFKNNRSTFIKESGGQLRGNAIKSVDENAWGYIDINSLKSGGIELKDKISFIHPDDDNADQTVISVPLDRPLAPNEEITIEINFTSKLPRIFARSGYANDYFLVAQWFPKIGVYEYPGIRYAVKGQWNCHQYHANSEFYADFAVYDVNITLPSNYLVGAAGLLKTKVNNINGTSTHYYRAEDVVDFAWTASPNFKVVTDSWNNIKISVLLQPEHFSQAERYVVSLKTAIEYFDKNLGKYPYPSITLVDPPLNGFGSGGMEYPTFITGGTIWNMPAGIKLPELVTIHEFGHNYFMALLASNEFEEAFLDEGFNQYYETRIMDHAYGVNTSAINLFGIKMGDFEMTRQGYVGFSNPKMAEIFRKSWEYMFGGYGAFTYNKTAVMLKTLEGLVGINTMNEIMKTYFERWKFKHPCVKDFISIVNEVVVKNHGKKFGDNMNWYFDQVLYGTDICDYKVVSISNQKIKGIMGLTDQEGKKKFSNGENEGNGLFKSKVVVFRSGEVKLPVEILIRFKDGKEILENWSGQERTKEFSFEGKSNIVWAKIDPYYKIPLDNNLINNSLTLETEKGVFTKYTSKILFWVENVMLLFSALF